MVRQCIICHDVIVQTEHGLCFAHRRFAELWSAVVAGARSEWYHNTGGAVSHKEMQLHPEFGATIPWYVIIDDINRMARSWLDGWGTTHDADGGGIAA